MQRKNNLLMKHRNGLALISAIIVMVLIGTLGALSLRLITQTTKTTTDVYLYEQASIYAKSAAELALLDIAAGGPCTAITPNPKVLGDAGDIQYDATIDLQYFYTSCPAGCTNCTIITTPEQNGSVMMDIGITLNDSSLTTEPIRYFRRTIQKL